jgi:hypothetical protein
MSHSVVRGWKKLKFWVKFISFPQFKKLNLNTPFCTALNSHDKQMNFLGEWKSRDHAQMDAGVMITMTTQCAYCWKMKTYDCLESVFFSRVSWFMSQVFNICIEGNAENVTQFYSPPFSTSFSLFSPAQRCLVLLLKSSHFKDYTLSEITHTHTRVMFILLFIRKTCVWDSMLSMVRAECVHILLNSYHNH